MADHAFKALNECGQSAWSDFIQRSFVKDGGLKKLVEQDGISGVTSNPTIFQKAIGSSSDYDGDLRQYAGEGEDPEGIFKKLASHDIRMGADILRPVYDRTSAQDGYISIEVSPDAAHDTPKTLDDAHFYWATINRPNIMIKVPATPEGIPAIEQLISEGINVNITLIFAVEVYEHVMEAYVRGLERRVEGGGSIDRIASVASFFVSRVDTLVDKLLEDKADGADDATREHLKHLEGKAAIANAKIAYELFQKVFGSDRFKTLAAKGAHVQRPLWASTSTKNPNYEDTYYVTNLVGRDTVNTMPPETIEAVRDHGRIECDTVVQGVAAAHRDIKELQKVGISMTEVTSQLTREGVQKFADSLHGLFDTINGKLEVLKQDDRQPTAAGNRPGGAGVPGE
jgi:transaldolase